MNFQNVCEQAAARATRAKVIHETWIPFTFPYLYLGMQIFSKGTENELFHASICWTITQIPWLFHSRCTFWNTFSRIIKKVLSWKLGHEFCQKFRENQLTKLSRAQCDHWSSDRPLIVNFGQLRLIGFCLHFKLFGFKTFICVENYQIRPEMNQKVA